MDRILVRRPSLAVGQGRRVWIALHTLLTNTQVLAIPPHQAAAAARQGIIRHHRDRPYRPATHLRPSIGTVIHHAFTP